MLDPRPTVLSTSAVSAFGSVAAVPATAPAPMPALPAVELQRERGHPERGAERAGSCSCGETPTGIVSASRRANRSGGPGASASTRCAAGGRERTGEPCAIAASTRSVWPSGGRATDALALAEIGAERLRPGQDLRPGKRFELVEQRRPRRGAERRARRAG